MAAVSNETDPEAVVRSFMKMWEHEGIAAGMERYMDPDGLWQNSGLPDARGREAYMALVRRLDALGQMPFCRVEILNLAVRGNAVLLERIDHVFNADRSRQHSARVMGTLVVERGRIQRFTDYFDGTDLAVLLNGQTV